MPLGDQSKAGMLLDFYSRAWSLKWKSPDPPFPLGPLSKNKDTPNFQELLAPLREERTDYMSSASNES